eukprot:2020689-Karenia_brevis.AAC.1
MATKSSLPWELGRPGGGPGGVPVACGWEGLLVVSWIIPYRHHVLLASLGLGGPVPSSLLSL